MTLGNTLARVALVVTCAITLAACTDGTDQTSDDPSDSPSASSPTATQPSDAPLTMADLAESPLKQGQTCQPDLKSHLVCTRDGKRAYTVKQKTSRPLVVRKATAIHPSESRFWAVAIVLDARSTKLLSRKTSELVGTNTSLGLFDQAGDLLVAAAVSSPISAGQVELGGNYSKGKARALARSLS